MKKYFKQIVAVIMLIILTLSTACVALAKGGKDGILIGLATLTADLTELANKLSDNLEKFWA